MTCWTSDHARCSVYPCVNLVSSQACFSLPPVLSDILRVLQPFLTFSSFFLSSVQDSSNFSRISYCALHRQGWLQTVSLFIDLTRLHFNHFLVCLSSHLFIDAFTKCKDFATYGVHTGKLSHEFPAARQDFTVRTTLDLRGWHIQ